MKPVLEIAKDARRASLELANIPTSIKNRALEFIADFLLEDAEKIIAANAKDIAAAAAAGLSKPMLERLAVNDKKIAAMVEGVKQVIALPDPVGEIIEESVRPNGLQIKKVRVPIGVIGIIYVISRALKAAGLNENCVQILPSSDRALLNEMLSMDSYINCIIPRGGEGLIRFVVKNSTIPVLKHYKGVCTVFIDKSADLRLAEILAVDAKCQRPSVCNAAENLIVHSDAADEILPKIAKLLVERGVELRASERAAKILKSANIDCKPATEQDFSTEYIDLIISIDIVDSVDGAVEFINKYGSGHSDLIVTSDAKSAEVFLNGVDSATVYWNASTRFTDGFEFGLGAEIGISTDKLHARGPMGLREMCSYKYKILGSGQTRGEPIK